MDLVKKLNDSIDIIKKNGNVYNGIKACCTPNVIICLGNIPIEVGDIIQRNIPNGTKERYRVKNPVFYSAKGTIQDHYQIRFERMDLLDNDTKNQNISYVINGNNARINNNSIDNSINIANKHDNILNLIVTLRREINKLDVNNQEKQEYLDIIESIEENYKSKPMKKNSVAILLKALPPLQHITEIVNNLLDTWGKIQF